MKKIKVIALSLFLASIFVCTAFADTRGQGVAISANNEASGIVSCKQEVNSDINSTGILPPIIPKIETFQVKRVRVYPAYTKPDRPGYHYYYKDKYAVNTIPGNNYGQVNTLKVSPTTTEKLRHSLDDLGHEATLWRMEMDCYVANYKNPSRFEFVSLDGKQKISQPAYNETKTFFLVFPIQDTTSQYTNGYKGSFSYYTTNGNIYTSLTAGGYVYLNDKSPDAK